MRIEQGARIIVENWLHAQPDDVLHLITDETRQRESEAFFHAARQIGAIPKLSILPVNSVQSGDSIEQMRNIMSYATAIVGDTSYSFITTNAVYYALHHGARFLSLPLSTNNGQSLLEQDFLMMDPAVAARMGRPMLRCLRGSDTVRITTKQGTDMPFVPSQTVNRPTPAPSMCVQDIARGIEAAIAAIAENDADLRTAEGQTH